MTISSPYRPKNGISNQRNLLAANNTRSIPENQVSQKKDMYQNLIAKKNKLAVIGLGYVGLPIALEFAKKISVIGFDINKKRVDLIKKGIDPNKEVESTSFQNRDILFTHEIAHLKEANFFIVAVPTPIDKYNVPDLKPLFGASET